MKWNVLLLALVLTGVGLSSCGFVGSSRGAGQRRVERADDEAEEIPCGKSTAVAATVQPTIRYGKQANPGQFPFQALLLKSQGKRFLCGGVIYDDYHILIAAHCLFDDSTKAWKKPCDFLVSVGDWNRTEFGDGEQVLEVDQLAGHEEFDNSWLNNDIAIIRVKTKMNWQLTKDGFGSVNRICMPEKGMEYEPGLDVIVSGFGLDEEGRMPDVLRYAITTVVKSTVCGENMSDRICIDGDQQHSFGDSGGPVVRELEDGRAELVGLVSAITSEHKPRPGIETNVSKYLDWIRRKIAEFER